MRRSWFFANFYRILGYAILGTLIATFLTGLMLWGLAKTPVLDMDLSLEEALAFGSLISATDPVTTLAIFQVYTARVGGQLIPSRALSSFLLKNV